MTLQELHEHCDRNWSTVCRRFDIAMTTIVNWRSKEGITMKAQRKIEKLTDGALKADMNHIGKHLR